MSQTSDLISKLYVDNLESLLITILISVCQMQSVVISVGFDAAPRSLWNTGAFAKNMLHAGGSERARAPLLSYTIRYSTADR